MLSFKINDFQYNIKNKLTVIQACLINKIDVPRFCFHEKLAIAGNCRMCLVEDIKQIKPMASCAINISPSSSLYTNTLKVKKARESVLEFLLANHPLDCPICDQGGECDLQDQSLVFGSDRGRFYEFKRSVEDKDCGPLIKTIMNRCIHCTRCVRFSNEIAGTSVLGVTGRGSKMEIGFYIEKLISSELSGNIIDLCPVGALTSKPFAFSSRPWELKSYNSIDILDSMHSNIRVDVRGTKIMRILPRVNENINEEWITDRIRFSYDSFRRQRLFNPAILTGSSFVKTSWKKTLFFLKATFLKYVNINDSSLLNVSKYVSETTDIETAFLLKTFFSNNGFFYFKNRDYDNTSSNYCNTHIKNIASADICVIIGENLRIKLPILNSKIKQAHSKNGLPIYLIGYYSNFYYFVKHVCTSTSGFVDILEGKHWLSVKLNKSFSGTPLFFFNSDLNYANFICNFTNLKTNLWNGINCIFSNRLLSELAFDSKNETKSNINFLFNYDDAVVRGFNVYLGHHGDLNASNSNVILPTSSFVEKNTHHLNVFGIVQKTKKVLFNVGDSRNDWSVVNALTFILKKSFSVYPNSTSVIEGASKTLPFILHIRPKNSSLTNLIIKNFMYFNNFVCDASNFYLSNSITRNSKIMSLCFNKFKIKNYNFF